MEGRPLRRVEYRIERIPPRGGERRLVQVVGRLAELGRRGWHVAAADLATHPGHEDEPVTVLLEREVDGDPAAG
jgi:hypothetical protein